MSNGLVCMRLAVLLPGWSEPQRQPVARALRARVRLLAGQSLATLLRLCSARLPADAAAALGAATSAAAEPDLLLAGCESAITPAVLLDLPDGGAGRLAPMLLAHPQAWVREQTLDALADPDAGRAPLRHACADWSRRMLIDGLGCLPGLSHTDQLVLQEELLAGDGNPPAATPEPQTLDDALRHGANRCATAILAARAGVALDVAEAAVALRDQRMLVWLCWKAGCDASEARGVQVQLARIPPSQAHRGPRGPLWPPDATAMQWRLAVLEDI